MALQDTHSNNFVTRVKAAHRWLGFIHAMYALGTLVGPTVATAIASAGTTSRWYLFYASLAAVGLINLVLVIVAFRDSMTKEWISPEAEPSNPQKRSAFGEMKAVVRLPSVWLLALYFFFFLGAVLTASGWTVQYLVTVRNGKLSEVGYVQTGFAGGLFLGRLLLAEPTKRLGERRMVFVYALLCLGLELLFWLVPNIVAGAVAISLFGFFSGPFFATGVSVGAQIFPQELRSSSLGMSTSIQLYPYLLTSASFYVHAGTGRWFNISCCDRAHRVKNRCQSLAAYSGRVVFCYCCNVAACAKIQPAQRLSCKRICLEAHPGKSSLRMEYEECCNPLSPWC